MSTFEVKAYEVTVSDHPNADRLELVGINGTEYKAVSEKGRWQTGERAVYIPEGAVIPEFILKAIGFWDFENDKGTLAGSKGDRVKAIKLRGALSQGILAKVNEIGVVDVADSGYDFSTFLGIKKYEPPIPVEMSGLVSNDSRMWTYTDIENIKKYPDVLQDGEEVAITEKIHGTCSIFSLVPEGDGSWELLVSSKGVAGKHQVLEFADGNLYWRVAKLYNIANILREIQDRWTAEKEVTIFGEISGVQDLKYNHTMQDPGWNAFDIRIDGKYLDYHDFAAETIELEINTVPALYIGPYSRETVDNYTSGNTELYPNYPQIREGVVVRPTHERHDDSLGRVILKSVSDKYLTRKNSTEME